MRNSFRKASNYLYNFVQSTPKTILLAVLDLWIHPLAGDAVEDDSTSGVPAEEDEAADAKVLAVGSDVPT